MDAVKKKLISSEEEVAAAQELLKVLHCPQELIDVYTDVERQIRHLGENEEGVQRVAAEKLREIGAEGAPALPKLRDILRAGIKAPTPNLGMLGTVASA